MEIKDKSGQGYITDTLGLLYGAIPTILAIIYFHSGTYFYGGIFLAIAIVAIFTNFEASIASGSLFILGGIFDALFFDKYILGLIWIVLGGLSFYARVWMP